MPHGCTERTSRKKGASRGDPPEAQGTSTGEDHQQLEHRKQQGGDAHQRRHRLHAVVPQDLQRAGERHLDARPCISRPTSG
jgi:hypothetical protein